LRNEKDMQTIQPGKSKIRKIKTEGEMKHHYKIKMDFVKVIDEIKEET